MSTLDGCDAKNPAATGLNFILQPNSASIDSKSDGFDDRGQAGDISLNEVACFFWRRIDIRFHAGRDPKFLHFEIGDCCASSRGEVR